MKAVLWWSNKRMAKKTLLHNTDVKNVYMEKPIYARPLFFFSSERNFSSSSMSLSLSFSFS